MSGGTRIARLIGWAGFTAAGALHAVWASGSTWPAKNAKRLRAAVAGSAKAAPSPEATWAVSGAAFTAGAVVAGGLGEGRAAVGLRRLIGLGLLARAAAGGEAALALLGLPAAGKRFRELDRRFYRPLFGVLGLAVLIGAKKK
ncbi:DUF3995 domain-containing protein [Leucobacter triazinivorans]|uniref:DUF3995 domain-containing protein n=1 Tax=Leucobacter triazinivorans TaxID=1784719 RepID=A0A4P6KHJ6_9MICO|nr:DUF3995 domain-containing protein [Leucobacter triazinivorans]QBE49551.1 DUF3995 domain-containing protein [Leucobacter triazinivorans]